MLIDDDTFSQCWNCCSKRQPDADAAGPLPLCQSCDTSLVLYGDTSIDPLTLVSGQPYSIEPFKLFACPTCGRVEGYLTRSALDQLQSRQPG
ncbi:hypothetical protein FCL40_03935 [Ferrimonas sediminicola]|uniref:Uncharacterized protein n=1 Tax=Ferrimonas sediminicola TaxID=2569538 RepID=A0A4U1BG68_9GAMM|nr:hypothetical protein [Ferrimonas sediminicola]TKB50318.1 hypothetical protein FCL40_03935 [Ferrimonas sediminicola]